MSASTPATAGEEARTPFDLVTALYEAAPKSRIKPARLAEYRCQPRGCLLLDVWRSPQYGPCYYIPAHRRGGPLAEFCGSGAGLMATCRDVKVHIAFVEICADADSARPGHPSRRFLANVPAGACWCIELHSAMPATPPGSGATRPEGKGVLGRPRICMPTSEVRQLATIGEAANLVHVHADTIRRRIAAGQLTGYRFGRLIRVDLVEVEALLRRIPTAGKSA